LPTSIIEAAACGKAIIASNVGGTSEIIENNRSGILFVPGNVSELVSALKLYLDRPDLQKLYGNTANMEIINKFHWDRSIKFYHDILLKLYA
jgi:glycosyltransferase involved in cell wall biosynthesis